MKQKSQLNLRLMGGIVVGVLIVAALATWKWGDVTGPIAPGSSTPTPVVTPTPSATPGVTAIPAAGPISLTGTMVCLPHQNTSGPQTLECAFGLKDTAGRYYSLSDTDPSYKNVSGVPMNVTVTVEGTFVPRLDSKYQSLGVIEVTKITVGATSSQP